ncbi:MAG: 4-hydroxythreonine-4-phosphate dehydrogenase PdxA [Opitutaceae bacterium]|nr:4-hydroxythreonine-4-phosphate dehydrogenase PdxA [Cephaloticoccus sp.]MCP5530052.1 4-hydroxythreonine-4-phosphate dehydrogenase PdxA [Opitutaceae bacterium]
MNPKLAITCGDPAGVGPEIIASWLRDHESATEDVVVIGPGSWLEQMPAGVASIAVGLAEFVAEPGRPTGEGALVALAAMELAAQGCREGRFAGVVTGPVSKAELAKIGYPFPGQTEFFADRWGGEPVMAFSGGKLRMALVTWHVPLCEVPQLLGPQLLHRTIAAADELARSESVEAPRIAVCGLNPHAGENGLLGQEERDFINPTLVKLQAEFPGLVTNCQPGDTVFARQLRGEFDVIVALYHDQGLGPLKTVDFDEAVNITLGLPFVRTSPDHGTAFGIAGQGRARGTSFANAVNLARRLIQRRKQG